MAITYRSSPHIIQSALMHMVGQMEDMKIDCSTADIAHWLGVTKPTAKKYLKALYEGGYIESEMLPYRPNFPMFIWTLSNSGRKLYYENRLCESYHLFRESRYNY